VKASDIVSLSGLCFSYDGADRAIFKDLSLEIPSGQITAIMGPNGSGKTTLLRLILGALTPQRGRILLAEQPQSSYSRREMGQLVGLVPQGEHISFNLSLLEYVLLGRAPYLGPLEVPARADHNIAVEALRAAGLAHQAGRPVANLSGGEQQLAIVARALAQRPRILLLDEPTSHLDLSNRGRLLDILRALSGDGMSLILTTHDPNLAAEVASFCILMRQGQVVVAGPAELTLTADRLSATYGVSVQVFRTGRRHAIFLA
jgi:iron complex transport system ATP-binding protein